MAKHIEMVLGRVALKELGKTGKNVELGYSDNKLGILIHNSVSLWLPQL